MSKEAMSNRELLEKAAQLLTKQGKPIEGGWLQMRAACVYSRDHLDDYHRLCFYAGAAHMLAVIMLAGDNEEDFARVMDAAHQELQHVRGTLRAMSAPTRGSA